MVQNVSATFSFLKDGYLLISSFNHYYVRLQSFSFSLMTIDDSLTPKEIPTLPSLHVIRVTEALTQLPIMATGLAFFLHQDFYQIMLTGCLKRLTLANIDSDVPSIGMMPEHVPEWLYSAMFCSPTLNFSFLCSSVKLIYSE